MEFKSFNCILTNFCRFPLYIPVKAGFQKPEKGIYIYIGGHSSGTCFPIPPMQVILVPQDLSLWVLIVPIIGGWVRHIINTISQVNYTFQHATDPIIPSNATTTKKKHYILYFSMPLALQY